MSVVFMGMSIGKIRLDGRGDGEYFDIFSWYMYNKSMNFKEFREAQIAEYENQETWKIMYRHEKFMEIWKDIIEIQEIVDLNDPDSFIDYIFTSRYLDSPLADQPEKTKDLIYQKSLAYILDVIDNNKLVDEDDIIDHFTKFFQWEEYYKNKLVKRIWHRIPEWSELFKQVSWNIILTEFWNVPVFIFTQEDYDLLRSSMSWLVDVEKATDAWIFHNWTILARSNWDVDSVLKTIKHEFWHFLQGKILWNKLLFSYSLPKNVDKRSSVQKRLKEELLSEVIAWNDEIAHLMFFLIQYAKDFIGTEIDFAPIINDWKVSLEVSSKNKKEIDFLSDIIMLLSQRQKIQTLLLTLEKIWMTKEIMILILAWTQPIYRDDLARYYTRVAKYILKNWDKLWKVADKYI